MDLSLEKFESISESYSCLVPDVRMNKQLVRETMIMDLDNEDGVFISLLKGFVSVLKWILVDIVVYQILYSVGLVLFWLITFGRFPRGKQREEYETLVVLFGTFCLPLIIIFAYALDANTAASAAVIGN